MITINKRRFRSIIQVKAPCQSRAFTLIELLVCVAIVAILASVAVGSYQHSILKTYRGQLIGELELIAAKQEAFYFLHHRYANNLQHLGVESKLKQYQISVSHLREDTGCLVHAQCYLLMARAINIAQKKDADCTYLTLASNGRRLPLACFK